MQLPEKFVLRMVEELGEEQGHKLCAALMTEPSTSVRMNPYKISQCSWDGRQIGWSSDGYTLHVRPSFTLDPLFHGGAYYVQEASSQFAGYVMQQALGGANESRGRKILDMCAAPGGKSTHYASIVGEEGLVVANEINRSRCAVLADNARKWGLGNMIVTCNDSSRYCAMEGVFDAVAVDAPCSGEGMFRKLDEAREQWSEANVNMCAERQWEILQNAFEALSPGGVLLYSTCTFNRSEDEGVVERMMEAMGEELESVPKIEVDPSWGVVCGEVGCFQTFRFFPHNLAGEGMFMAVAKRCGEPNAKQKLPKVKRQIILPVDRKSQEELSRWVKCPEQMRFFEAGETIYGCRAERYQVLESLSSALSVVYSGVAMGQIFKGKLKPDASLAFYVGLAQDVVPNCEVGLDDALRFLRKQDLDAAMFEDGINLVKYDALPLGFVKRVGNRVNNMYPNSLRILK